MRLYHYNMQAVRELLNCGVNLNARNLEGHTAQDMLQEQTQVNNSMISDLLIPRKTGLFLERVRLLIKTARERSRISNDDRNALLVVAALLITITYQVVITPPGGLQSSAFAGTAMAQLSVYPNFNIVATINYITFTLSTIMTFLLLPSGYISALFKMALVHLWVSYYYSLAVILIPDLVLYYCLISTGLCFVLVVFTFFGRQFCGARIRCLPDSSFYILYACILFFVAFLM